MAVRWKFRSEADLKSFRLNGRRNVTVGELKSSILVSRKGLEAMEIDIYNPNTEEKYYDDDIISRGENVEVRVRPLEGLARPSTTSESNAHRPHPPQQQPLSRMGRRESGRSSTTKTTSTTDTTSSSSMADVLATRAAAAEKKRKHANGRAESSAPPQPKNWVKSKRPKQFTKAQQEQYQQGQQQEQTQRKPKTKEVMGIPHRFLLKKVGDDMELNADGSMATQSMTHDGEQVVGIMKMVDTFKKKFQKRDGGDGPADQDFEDDGSHLREGEFEGSEVIARGDATLVIGSTCT
jgi:hypothetical protein